MSFIRMTPLKKSAKSKTQLISPIFLIFRPFQWYLYLLKFIPAIILVPYWSYIRLLMLAKSLPPGKKGDYHQGFFEHAWVLRAFFVVCGMRLLRYFLFFIITFGQPRMVGQAQEISWKHPTTPFQSFRPYS